MCGIFGYSGEKPAKMILVEGLKNLEYRGYDSAGIAVVQNEKIVLAKKVGKVVELENYAKQLDMVGCIGIGHTRWATHGVPNETNCHPHSSNDGDLVVVHNGIIANYKEIKGELIEKGARFVSDTDTEVIVHLLNEYLKSMTLEDAVCQSMKKLTGSYAYVCMNKYGKLIGCSKGNPLLVAVGDNSTFFASDLPALKQAKEYYRLKQEQVIVVEPNKNPKLYCNEQFCDIPFEKLECFDRDTIADREYSCVMEKEIFETPQVVEACVKRYSDLNKFDVNCRAFDEILLFGCGSAYHACSVVKEHFKHILDVRVNVEIASEILTEMPFTSSKTLCVAVSQSGETAETIAATKLLKNRGLQVLCVTNSPQSSLADICDDTFDVCAGIETAVASTKAYIAQICTLTMLCLKLAQKFDKQIPSGIFEAMAKLPRQCELVLANFNKYKEIAISLKNKKNVFFIGRNTDYFSALECALKIKEVSYINATAFPAGELKHGPLALVDDSTVVFSISSVPRLREKIENSMHEIIARGGSVVEISPLAVDDGTNIVLPTTTRVLLAVLVAIPVQCISFLLAQQFGYDPDRPRNLAKSVTVE